MLTFSGKVYHFGSRSEVLLGVDQETLSVPASINLNDVQFIDCAKGDGFHAIAATESKVFAWGRNTAGQFLFASAHFSPFALLELIVFISVFASWL